MTLYSGVQCLADLLILDEYERREYLLMPLTVKTSFLSVPANGYLDETEHDDIVGVGGWLGTYEAWQSFESRWRVLLPTAANGDFHYTDFWHDPTYWSASWSHEKRLEFIQTLADLVIQHASVGLGIVVSRSEYEGIIPREDQDAIGGPVYFCLMHCLRLLIEHYDTLPSKPPAPLRFMHDSKEGKEGWIAEWYYSVRNVFRQNTLFGELSFGRRSNEPVLQAADLLIGELRRHREGHESKIIDILRMKQNILVAFPTDNDLRKIVKAAMAGTQQ